MKSGIYDVIVVLAMYIIVVWVGGIVLNSRSSDTVDDEFIAVVVKELDRYQRRHYQGTAVVDDELQLYFHPGSGQINAMPVGVDGYGNLTIGFGL